MKIGIYCTNNIIYPVPAGTIYANMAIAGNLADQLVDLGHDVTFFAPKGTLTKANLVTFDMLPFSDPSIHSQYPHEGSSYFYEDLMLIQSLNYAADHNFDVFHGHTRPFSMVNFAPLKPELPIVCTVHDPLSDSAYSILPQYNQFQNLHFISISHAQEKTRPSISWFGTVYNGIDITKWTFCSQPKDYLLYAGRLVPEKGADLAIQIAQEANMQLFLAGSYYPQDQIYFDEKIKPFLGDQIVHLGAIGQEELVSYYQNAKALLFPLQWEEPFGLVMIEAMSCGTPVITTNHGAAPEIVVHEKTGYIVENGNAADDFLDAVNSINKLNRLECRKHIENTFTLKHMAQNYAKLYRTIVN